MNGIGSARKNWFSVATGFIVLLGLPLGRAAAQVAVMSPPPATGQRAQMAGAVSEPALPTATLQKLRELIGQPALADGRIGVSIRYLGKAASKDSFALIGPVSSVLLFENDADKRFLPASNMKLYTAAIALKTLGANAVFDTRVLAPTAPVLGRVRGTLILQGGGDPALNIADLAQMARQVRAAGIRQIGGVSASGAAYGGGNINDKYPDGWTLDDALWDYGAEVSALALHRNEVDVVVRGGARPGARASIAMDLDAPGFQLGRELQSTVATGDDSLLKVDEDDLVQVNRALAAPGETVVCMSGAVAPGQRVKISLAVPNHEAWAAHLFAAALVGAGVKIVPDAGISQADSKPIVLMVHHSPPLTHLLRDFLKPSDNLYGEMLLRDTALRVFGAGQGTAQQGHALAIGYLRTLGIDTDALRFSDGSGLSRYNLVTPNATTRLLAGIAAMPGGEAIWNALPVAGVDGTLKKRMVGTPAAANARAKTGTFSIVSCLSGYVTTRDGARLAVSILTNDSRHGDDARKMQNDVFVLLAGTAVGGG